MERPKFPGFLGFMGPFWGDPQLGLMSPHAWVPSAWVFQDIIWGSPSATGVAAACAHPAWRGKVPIILCGLQLGASWVSCVGL